jgi:hypothetical protein
MPIKRNKPKVFLSPLGLFNVSNKDIKTLSVLLLVSVLAQAFFPLVRRHLVSLAFFSARHLLLF